MPSGTTLDFGPATGKTIVDSEWRLVGSADGTNVVFIARPRSGPLSLFCSRDAILLPPQ